MSAPAAPTSPVYGMLAEFADDVALVRAADAAHRAGFTAMDAYSPIPVEGLYEALGRKRSKLPWMVLGAGITGGSLGYLLQYWISAVNYPLNVGGRPYHSIPSFIPVTFEMTILLSALTAVFGMLLLNGLPRPHHPIFNAPSFAGASTDKYFLCIEATDPRFDAESVRTFLAGLGAVDIQEVANDE